MRTSDDDGTWQDDMLLEAVQALVSKAVGEAAREEIELPHIVVCRDLETGAVSYSGPFPNGLSALVFAEQESVLDQSTNPVNPMQFGVAALFPAHDDLV
jgi:hypothetical protein